LFLNHINTDAARKVNPTIKIVTDVLNDPTAPSHIQVAYKDGQKLSLDADKMKISNIVQTVNKHAKKLEEIEEAKNW
jgi:large subunit ribosomal protein L53